MDDKARRTRFIAGSRGARSAITIMGLLIGLWLGGFAKSADGQTDSPFFDPPFDRPTQTNPSLLREPSPLAELDVPPLTPASASPSGTTNTASVAAPVAAAVATQPRTPIRRSTNSPSGEASQAAAPGRSAWSTFGVLAVLIAVIVWLGRMYRRHAPAASQRLPDAALTLLGRRMLDPQTAIHFLRIGDRILIVGAAGDGLRTLTEIDDPIEVERLTLLCRSEMTHPSGPLRSMLGAARAADTRRAGGAFDDGAPAGTEEAMNRSFPREAA